VSGFVVWDFVVGVFVVYDLWVWLFVIMIVDFVFCGSVEVLMDVGFVICCLVLEWLCLYCVVMILEVIEEIIGVFVVILLLGCLFEWLRL